MDKPTHEFRLSQWKNIILQCQARPDGQTQKEWLAENGISDKQYYYWQRLVRRAASLDPVQKALPAASNHSDEITFAEIHAPETTNQTIGTSEFHADAILHLGPATVALANTASAELLDRIIGAVSHAC